MIENVLYIKALGEREKRKKKRQFVLYSIETIIANLASMRVQ